MKALICGRCGCPEERELFAATGFKVIRGGPLFRCTVCGFETRIPLDDVRRRMEREEAMLQVVMAGYFTESANDAYMDMHELINTASVAVNLQDADWQKRFGGK